MSDMGWSKHIADVEYSECAKACEKEKRKAELIPSGILNCVNCKLWDCGI